MFEQQMTEQSTLPQRIIGATMFSGIGAPETAMPSWDWAWSAEIEKFPAAVLAERHPESTNLGDVTADDFAKRAAIVGRPDVLVFGSPCQSYSVAGKRLGLDDPRGNLALVALGIVDRLKPDWFVFENVPGLLSSSEGRDFGIFLRTVDDVGYHVAWAMLDAQHFGVAQRRQRLFAVGHLGDWRYPAAVLLEPESLCGDSPPRRKAGEGVAPTIASRPTGGGGLGTDFDCDGGLITLSLNAHPGRIDGESETFIAFSCKDHGADAGELAPTLRSMGHDGSHANAGGQVAIAFGAQMSTPHWQNGVCDTLQAKNPKAVAVSVADTLGVGANQTTGFKTEIASVGSAVRRLTPRECERLQGFPDDYTFITYRGKPAADGPRYKALGNSMPVPVMRWILNRIEIAGGRQ